MTRVKACGESRISLATGPAGVQDAQDRVSLEGGLGTKGKGGTHQETFGEGRPLPGVRLEADGEGRNPPKDGLEASGQGSVDPHRNRNLRECVELPVNGD